MNKFQRVADTLVHDPLGSGPPNGYEVGAEIAGRSRVIVGISIRMDKGDLTTLHLYGRRLNKENGKLIGDVHVFVAGSAPHHAIERSVNGNNLDDGPNRVLTGLWARAQPGDITAMTLWTKSIDENGELEGLVPAQTGRPPPNGFEAELILPSPFVVTGVALRANPGNVTHIRGLFSVLKPASP